MRTTVIVLLAISLALALPVFGQESAPTAPPKVLKILRETIKPGAGAAHEANESAWIHALKDAHYNVPTQAMTSLTGDSQVWFMAGFPSWAEYQAYVERWHSDAALGRIASTYGPKERDFVSDTETVTCRYHAEYSYQPDFNFAAYKYIAVGVLRFRPGTDIAAYFKTLEAARAKAKLDNHTVVYEINSGTHGGTYLTFTPMSSLARWDIPQDPAFLAALRESNWRQMVGADLMDSEQRLFEFSPEMSLK
ncbi:MAG: hypothetical protein ACRD3E_20915 [Terriglobales bacterium]